MLVSLSWLHRGLILFFSALIVIALFFLPDPHQLAPEQQHRQLGQRYPLPLTPVQLAQPSTLLSTSLLRWQKHQVSIGESAAAVFQKMGLSSRLLYELTHSDPEILTQLSKLLPNDELDFGFDEKDQLVQLRRKINAYDTFVIQKTHEGYQAHWDKKERFYQYNYAEAEIQSNFWNAAIQAGLSPNQIMELAGIFGWDIDFALDLRAGDRFRLLYQEIVVEGEVIGHDKIIAATFTNQGTEFTAILDEDSQQFYDENGRAMKKTFLRSPVDFRRVSSNFNPKRLHPVTGKVTAHRGTDYVAPVGTPIWAAGDGVVEQSSYNQFNGHYVFIRHSNTYMTKYLHLNRRTVKTGQRVKQGQVIGTLGGTGRVTGPHLHYEFLVNGVHQNARTVDLPQARSLTGEAKKVFLKQAQQRLQQLSRYGQLMYSSEKKSPNSSL